MGKSVSEISPIKFLDDSELISLKNVFSSDKTSDWKHE